MAEVVGSDGGSERKGEVGDRRFKEFSKKSAIVWLQAGKEGLHSVGRAHPGIIEGVTQI